MVPSGPGAPAGTLGGDGGGSTAGRGGGRAIRFSFDVNERTHEK